MGSTGGTFIQTSWVLRGGRDAQLAPGILIWGGREAVLLGHQGTAEEHLSRGRLSLDPGLPVRPPSSHNLVTNIT